MEQANHQLPNLSKNLFILFNHWDRVVDEDDDSGDPETLRQTYLQNVQEFLVQGLQSNGVLEHIFFVSGKEVCQGQENEQKGKQPSAGE